VNKKSIVLVLSRALRLRCPACGQASIACSPFRLQHHCPNCRSLFKREEGFFVGAILANVLTTEFVILLVCGFWLLVIGSSYESVLAGLVVVILARQKPARQQGLFLSFRRFSSVRRKKRALADARASA